MEVVNRWNACVDLSETEQPSHTYVQYLLQVYQRLAKLDEELGAERLVDIEHTWASFPPGSPRVG